MPRDEFVSGLGNPCETRDVIVAPRQPFPRRSISQRTIHGFGGKEGFAIRVDERYRTLELFDWNFREPRSCLLISAIIHFASSDLAPAFDPPLAKMTLAIPNHERFWRRVRNAKMFALLHKRPTSNVQRPTSNSESEFDVGYSALSVGCLPNSQTPPIPGHERTVPCPCAFQCLFPMRCSALLVFH